MQRTKHYRADHDVVMEALCSRPNLTGEELYDILPPHLLAGAPCG